MNIIGLSLFLGFAVPDYFEKNPVATGVKDVDQMLNVLLTLKMFVGGVVAFILDNVCPGQCGQNKRKAYD